jgi:predicted Rossmann fold flavoprotein
VYEYNLLYFYNMKAKIYDAIILWAWPAWLFCANKIGGWKSILILERNDSPAQKLLLSAKWRWNITNVNIDPIKDYATDDSIFVKSAFDKFWVKDFLEFLDNEWIEIKEENNGRILLKSGKVKEFHEKLLQLVENKWIEIRYNTDFLDIDKLENWDFKIKTSNWDYYAKNFIVATWWPSFPKLWATAIASNIASKFGLTAMPFYPALVWFKTNQNFSSLSGSSVIWRFNLLKWDKVIYGESWTILFTHRWISGPAVFNSSLFMRENLKESKSKYKVRLFVSDKEITKRLLSFLWFRVNKLKEYTISSDVVNVRWLDEAKVCWWWVETENLNDNFECKDIPWLYFIGECLDVTGKTWWFNLQRCRTSGAVCADEINKK